MPLSPLKSLLRQWRAYQERSRLWRISRRINEPLLHAEGEDEPLLVPEDFLLPESRAGLHFLGTYSLSGLEYATRAYGLWDELQRAARGPLRVEVSDTAAAFHRLRYIGEGDSEPVGECRAALQQHQDQPWLYIDWMLLQRPHADFDLEHPPLPGQEHPGLGLGHELLEILLIMGSRLRCRGVMGRPAHFHNAVMYRSHFRFENPKLEGRLRAIRAAQRRAGLSLSEASWAVEQRRLVRESNGRPVRWEPGLLLAPLHPDAEFQDDGYAELARRAETVDPLRFLPP